MHCLPKLALPCALLVAIGGRAHAQDLAVLAGSTRFGDEREASYAWELEYRQGLGPYLAWSAAWINEGHADSHRRDGIAGQLWALAPLVSPRFVVGAGAGAYYYHDTEPLPDGDSKNLHGWAPAYSLTATYDTGSPWLLQLLANRISPRSAPHSDTILAGVGYDFGRNQRHRPAHFAGSRASGDELTAFGGASIVNTVHSETGIAAGLEYRKRFGRYFAVTGAWMDEGDTDVVNRTGLAAQLWLENGYLRDRLTLGLGAGPYYYMDRAHRRETELATMLSPSASLRLGRHWLVRALWNRVMTSRDRDSDVLLLGLGYRWAN